MIWTLFNSLVFSLISYYFARYLTQKYSQIQRWPKYKKKRFAVLWAVLFGTVMLGIKWLYLYPAGWDQHMQHLFIFGMKHNLMTHCLNGCLAFATCMGMVFYMGLLAQSHLLHYPQSKRIKSSQHKAAKSYSLKQAEDL
ncbi:hypothetical protein EC844_11412 [Acinetobacter calcoaceticus]|uniref:Uncharacterized protein n=1 Tax=Acinetobacter calcoaceticus TaxID=471 RepID=A0A4R1XUC1_ACICA|nr:hypothetical protein EC844_11412 [Acinetobacter calcoaceticus]